MAEAKLTPEQVIELGEDTKPAKDKVDAALRELTSLATAVEGIKLPQLENFQNRSKQAAAECNAALEECSGLVDAVDFLLLQEKAAIKKSKNQVRYQKRKIVNRLVIGSYGTRFAKALTALFDDPGAGGPVMNPEKFDPALVSAWICGVDDSNETAVALEYMFTTMVTAIGEAFESRTESLLGYLVKKPKSGGAMCRLDFLLDQLDGDFSPMRAVKAAHLDHSGASPWLVALRMYALRYGPQAMPLVGIGCFVRSCGKTPVSFIALPAEEVLSRGIALPDLMAYVETESGQEVLNDFGKIIHVSASVTAWLPYGWISIPVKWEDPNSKDMEDGKLPVPDSSCGSRMSTIVFPSCAGVLARLRWELGQERVEGSLRLEYQSFEGCFDQSFRFPSRTFQCISQGSA